MDKRTLLAACMWVAAGTVAEEVFMEFEGAAMPEGIVSEKSTVSLDARRRYRGGQSLKWDWQPGATLRIDCPVECAPERNRREEGFLKTRCFKFWIYNEIPMPGKQLKVVFGDEQGEPCSFPFNLDFSGWRSRGRPLCGQRHSFPQRGAD